MLTISWGFPYFLTQRYLGLLQRNAVRGGGGVNIAHQGYKLRPTPCSRISKVSENWSSPFRNFFWVRIFADQNGKWPMIHNSVMEKTSNKGTSANKFTMKSPNYVCRQFFFLSHARVTIIVRAVSGPTICCHLFLEQMSLGVGVSYI